MRLSFRLFFSQKVLIHAISLVPSMQPDSLFLFVSKYGEQSAPLISWRTQESEQESQYHDRHKFDKFIDEQVTKIEEGASNSLVSLLALETNFMNDFPQGTDERKDSASR